MTAEKKPAHTPGPWVVNGFGGDFRVIARMQPHEVAVSATEDGGDEISNARLIAAAPDMYEALKAIVTEGDYTDPEGMKRIARAALLKAEGNGNG